MSEDPALYNGAIDAPTAQADSGERCANTLTVEAARLHKLHKERRSLVKRLLHLATLGET